MECLKKMKDGDLEAKKELTLRNMRLVAHVAKKYQNSDEDMEAVSYTHLTLPTILLV